MGETKQITILYKYKQYNTCPAYDCNGKPLLTGEGYLKTNNYTLDALNSHKLWVSMFQYLNDPRDFLYKLSKKISNEDGSYLRDRQEELRKIFACLSFSEVYSCRRLWNYYTDGMTGIVLGYNKDDIEKSIKKEFDIDDVDKTDYEKIKSGQMSNYDHDKQLCFKGHVKYTRKVRYLTKFYKRGIDFLPNYSFFRKDPSWKDEKEYRYVFGFIEEQPINGFMIQNVKPIECLIGYRMKDCFRNEVFEYCKRESIALYECFPLFTKTNSLVKRPIYLPNGNNQSVLPEITPFI